MLSIKHAVAGAYAAIALGAMLWVGKIWGEAAREPSSAESAYLLERAATTEVHRAMILADELRLRALDTAQCVSPAVMRQLSAWAQKCVIPNCSIDVGGKPYVGLVGARPTSQGN